MPPPEEESTGDAALDARLAEPILKGYEGLDRAQVGISVFLIVVVGAVAFSNVLGIPFHFADRQAVVENVGLHRLATAPSGWDAYSIRPVTGLSLALWWQVGGGGSGIFHFVNLCLHLCSGVLVYLLCRGLLGAGAPEAVSMVGGMLFAVHPAVTQTVNSTAHHGTLLATFFVLLCAVLYVRAAGGTQGPRMGTLLLSALCFAVAWGCDVSVWIVPLLLLFVDVVVRKGGGLKARATCQAPFWVLLTLLIVTHAASGAASEGFPDFSGVWAQARAAWEPLRLIAVPVGLSVEHAPYGTEGQAFALLWAVLGLVGLGLLRFVPVPGVGLLWCVLALAAPGLFAADASLREERLYLVVAGAVLVVPGILNALRAQPARVAGGVVAAALVVACGVTTFMRNQVWQSELGLWADAGEKCGECPGPPARLGTLDLSLGENALNSMREAMIEKDLDEVSRQRIEATSRFEEAERYLSVAARHGDAPPEVWYELGKAQRFLGKMKEALASTRKALDGDLSNPDYTVQLAMLLEAEAQRSGRRVDLQRALDYYRRAQRLGPLPTEAALRYGTLLARIGDIGKSEAILRGVVAEDAPAPAAQTLKQVRRALQGVAALQSQVRERASKNPTDPELLGLSARQLFMQGKFLQASYLIEAKFRAFGIDAELWMLLALCKVRMGDFDVFLAEWSFSAPTDAGASPWRELAKRCATLGEWAPALTCLEEDVSLREDAPLPMISLAELALGLGDGPRALGFLEQAAAGSPEDAGPWLRMCDLAAQAGRLEAARGYLAAAEARGAPADAVAARSERVGEPAARRKTRTFIR